MEPLAFVRGICFSARCGSSLRRCLGLICAAAGLSAALAARPACADLKFVNNYPTRIYLAVAYYDGVLVQSDPVEQSFPLWRSIGWYPIDSGQTFTFWHGSPYRQNRYWYAYAISEDGSAERRGNYAFRVGVPDAFDWVLTEDDHHDSSYPQRGFFQIDMGQYDNFTWNLNP